MKYLHFFLASTLLLFCNALFAQGNIRGTVIEDATGEPLFGVTVQIKGTTTGSISDFDGKFDIPVAAGTYDVLATFVGFQQVTITGLIVQDGKVTIIDQIRMKEDVELLEEVVITAEVVKTTEAALLTVKRKSANLIDGISAASFRKIGDSDAGEAVKRVTGVSVEGGKYVFVRGLGDRYTKTMLNTVDIPGLDPDRNSLQIDIFPTNLIDNMIVLKTALAELPADFTGGVVDIQTKDFPDEKITDVSLGISFNPSMHFNSDFLTYEGSDSDWLGFDSDLRQLPGNAIVEDYPLPSTSNTPQQDQAVLDLTRSFSPVLGAQNETSFMDYNVGLTLGNQKTLGNGNNLGYIFAGTYKSSRQFYDGIIFGEFQRPQQADSVELVTATFQTGGLGTISTLLGGLGGLAYKTDNSKFRLTAMHLQNGETRAGQFRILDDPENRAVGKSGYIATSDNLEYSQRSLTNFLLNGEHHLSDDSWVIDWKISPTISKLEDPDIRKAAFSLNPQGEPIMNAGQAGFPSRIWRNLDETNIVGKIDFTRNATAFGQDAKFKFGGSYLFKERDYEILTYQLAFFGTQPTWSGDANEILLDEFYYGNGGPIYYQSQNITPNSNAYNSTATNAAGYASAEFSPLENLKVILGVRAENFVQKHSGRDQVAANLLEGVANQDSLIAIIQTDTTGNLGRVLNDDEVLNSLDFFPSLNLIYELKEKQNIRFSYSRTIARPSFKELSFAQILDPVSNRTFNGGLFAYEDPITGEVTWDGNLRETYIDNFDIRWEMFQDRGQTISISAFYKNFADPIELVRIPSAQTTNEFQPRNVGDGQVYGGEFEIRKVLDFISPSLSNFTFSTNVTVTESILDMTEVEFEARQRFEKVGETVEDTRQMAGQAPYVINAGIAYENFDRALEAGFYYNVQGETLTIVGGGLFPDVFSEPFHSLNFNLNKRFGADEKVSLNFSITNVLGDVKEQFFQGFEARDRLFQREAPATSIGLGIGYSL